MFRCFDTPLGIGRFMVPYLNLGKFVNDVSSGITENVTLCVL